MSSRARKGHWPPLQGTLRSIAASAISAASPSRGRNGPAGERPDLPRRFLPRRYPQKMWVGSLSISSKRIRISVVGGVLS